MFIAIAFVFIVAYRILSAQYSTVDDPHLNGCLLDYCAMMSIREQLYVIYCMLEPCTFVNN